MSWFIHTSLTNHIRLHYYLIATLLFCHLAIINNQATSKQSDNEISFKLSTEKTEYVEQEAIWVQVVVENLSKSDVSILEPSKMGDLLFRILDKKGKQVPFSLIMDRIGRPKTITLPSGSIKRVIIPLGFYNNYSETKESVGAIWLIPGAYTIQTFLGNLKSNVVEFKVNEPSKNEQDALESIIRDLKHYHDPKTSYSNAMELLRRFPKSVYVPDIYGWLFARLTNSDDPVDRSTTLINVSLEFLDIFQNSWCASHAIHYYLQGIRSELGFKIRQKLSPEQWALIESNLIPLKQKYKNENISMFIDKDIAMRKEWESHLKEK